ncbi:Lysine--tRNA ligase, partial [ANME-1 cluster archaeon GoMg2]|nr:Lysine--tRNA ligase [ANME-1 cluster archaeon GoMg2]
TSKTITQKHIPKNGRSYGFTYKYRAELDIRGLEIGECVILGNDADELKSHCIQAISDRHGVDSDKFLLDTIYLDEIENHPVDAAGGGLCIDRFLMVITKEKVINNVVWYPFKRGEIL